MDVPTVPRRRASMAIEILLISALAATTVFLFVPLRLFLHNFYEFRISFPLLLAYLLIISMGFTLCFFLLIGLLSLLVPRKMRNGLLSLAFALGFLAWLQSILNLGNYGVFDGRPIDWLSGGNRFTFYLEIAIWVVGIVLIVANASRISKYLTKACLILLVTQLLGVATLSVTTLDSAATPWWNQYATDSQNKFAFSDRQNVILLVVDTFQSTLFEELRAEHPELVSGFDGFTCYPDTVGGFPVTQPSVPLILTGTYYDNSVPYVEFVKTQFEQHSIPTLLKKEGFQSDVYPMVPITVYLTPASASNLKKIKFQLNFKKDDDLLARLVDASWFQVSPQPIKKRLYNSGHWVLQAWLASGKGVANSSKRRNKDMLFIEHMEKAASLRPGPPVFKFYHWNGIHSPLTLNEELEPEDMPEERGSYKRQSIAMLKIIDRFLGKLKAIGAYDNSLIIIVADHGFGPIGIHDPSRGQVLSDSFYKNDLFMGAALPFLLVKPAGATGELQTSDVQAMLQDIPKTIFSQLKLDSSFEGISVIDARASDIPRTRRWYNFSWKWLSGNNYLPALIEYEITGNSWMEESWRLSHIEYEPQQVVSKTPPPISLGEAMAFGEEGRGLQYVEMGWSQARKGMVWSTQSYASLGIPLPSTHEDLNVAIRCLPFLVPSQIDAQRVEIYVNDQHLQDIHLANDDFETVQIEIPKKIIQDDYLKIAFKFPDAASPSSYDLGRDHRTLGIALKEMTISESK